MDPPTNQDGSSHPAEQSSPRPTYAPAAMALGVTFTVWGFLTYWVNSAAGLALFAWSIWAWVQEVRHAWRTS